MIAQLFTRAGNTPDTIALGNAIRATIGDPFYIGVRPANGGGWSVVIEKLSAWQAAEMTAVQAAVTAAPDRTDRTDAQYQSDALPLVWKAIALTLLDEINTLRTAAGLTPRTVNQALTAIRTKAGTL